jgi:DNA ligase-1
VREDKNVDDATGPDQVHRLIKPLLPSVDVSNQIAEMYRRQALAQKDGKKKGGDDDGFW